MRHVDVQMRPASPRALHLTLAAHVYFTSVDSHVGAGAHSFVKEKTSWPLHRCIPQLITWKGSPERVSLLVSGWHHNRNWELLC